MTDKQDQSATDGATAIQAGRDLILYEGLSYSEVRQVALDVSRNTLVELTNVARRVAEERVEEITDSVLEKLRREHPDGLGQANNPGFQYALAAVQKEHARYGDKELGDLLVDLLVDRTKQPDRDIRQIVLDESISTAPKLTERHLSTLALIFLFRYTCNNSLGSHKLLGEYFDSFAKPFRETFATNASAFQHLQFTGCGSNTLAQVTLAACIGQNYPGLFSKGFEQSLVEKRGVQAYEAFFVPCLNDASKIQVRAINQYMLDKNLHSSGVPAADAEKIQKLLDHNKMSEEEIKTKCVEIRPYMDAIFEGWAATDMASFALTSVGLAIGHANIKRLVGEFSDLSIWVN